MVGAVKPTAQGKDRRLLTSLAIKQAPQVVRVSIRRLTLTSSSIAAMVAQAQFLVQLILKGSWTQEGRLCHHGRW